MLSSNAKNNLLKELEDEYGDQLLDLGKCTEIYNSLLQQKSTLEQECSTTNQNSLIGATIINATSMVGQSSSIIKESEGKIEKLTDYLHELDEIRKNLKQKFDELIIGQTTLQYMRVTQQIDYLCTELKQEFPKKDDEKCVTLFANLTEISRILSECQVNNLKAVLKESVLYWYNVLKAKLSRDFEKVLKLLKWPFVSSNFSLVAPLDSNIEKLQIIAEYLLQIKIPAEYHLSADDGLSGVLNNFQSLSLPIECLVEPLRKRFIFHFYGNKKTNRFDRPEWYFTQILTWIRDHQDYVDKWIQPVIDKFGLHYLDGKIEFMRGLVQLAAEKLNTELPLIQYDDYTFSHSIDEALGFDKELRDIYEYPAHEPGIIVILTQAPIMVKWLTMEKKYALEKMDSILSANSIEAFDLLTSDVEDLKITTCADAFITLLQTIAERYECLPQPGHRLQFLELQLELLDDFRVRLMQILNAEEGDYMETKVPMVANTLFYVEGVLIDWGYMINYLNLYYYKTQTNKVENQTKKSPLSNFSDFEDSYKELHESDSVFEQTLSLYKHFRMDILMGLAEAVLIDIKAKVWNYRRENWSTMIAGKDFRTLSLTPSACPLFEVLAKRLHQLENKLHSKLFTIVWRNIANQLDAYLFENLILDNRFNDGGALQVKYDIMRNLLPLFAQYTDNPESYFVQLVESCILLNLAKGSALLLRETLLALEDATGVEDTRGKMLQDIGVNNFGSNTAIKILNQRVDITIKRLNVD